MIKAPEKRTFYDAFQKRCSQAKLNDPHGAMGTALIRQFMRMSKLKKVGPFREGQPLHRTACFVSDHACRGLMINTPFTFGRGTEPKR